MNTPYIEKDCVFRFEGQDFESGGAVVTPDYLIAYPGEGNELKDWHGKVIGTYKIISSKKAIFFGRWSWQGDKYYFMQAKVNNILYSLRGFGPGMVAKGKRIKN